MSANLQRVSLQEVSTELRASRKREHILTAAVMVGLGVIAACVATLSATSNLTNTSWWKHPALLGAVAAIVVPVAVWLKIQREHKLLYAPLRQEQIGLTAHLSTQAGLQQSDLPAGLRRGSAAGAGYRYSGIVLAASAIGTFLFCLAVWAIR